MEKNNEIKNSIKKNIEFLFDENKLRGLFSDVFVNDVSYINLIIIMFKEGIVNNIVKDANDEHKKTIFLSKVINDYSLDSGKAKNVIDDWYDILDAKIIEAYKFKLVEKEQIKKNNVIIEDVKEPSNGLAPIDKGWQSDDEKYLNPTPIKDGIYIPCGVGNNDYGFKIKGIAIAEKCKHTHVNIFALVYNYFIRNSVITKEDYPAEFVEAEEKSKYAIEYQDVYRWLILILMLIKNNYLKDDILNIRLKNNEDKNNIELAINIINRYFNLFCRIADEKGFNIKLNSIMGAPVVSIHDKADIYIENVTKFTTNARMMWFGKKINYKIGNDKKNDFELLLREFSSFTHFKEGQFEALCLMLNAKGHSICIMPTGSGKSLIYYFASLLQPLAVFVVTPTEVLIKDQIRNLKKFHRYDNVAHLKLTENNNFSYFEITNNLLYLTPMTFQTRDLFCKSNELLGKPDQYGIVKHDNQVAYVVLDEIHCLSHWGHDFRPEYLMLSKNLKAHFDKTTYLGFTATANFSVVDDIQKQLDIPETNISSPIQFEKYNIKYDYRAVKDEKEMYETVKMISKNIVNSNERAIIFTKTDRITDKIIKFFNNEDIYIADSFTNENLDAYHAFADGKCNILVTNEELGIGINFPNVNNIIHFGMPMSKNEYVQEVGRAGRNNERVTSYIIYLNDTKENINSELLKRETSIDNLSNALKTLDNDYVDAYHKLTNNMSTSDVLYEKIIDIYSNFNLKVENDTPIFSYICPKGTEKIDKLLLYILYVTGYINDFYSFKINNKNKSIEIIIDIWATNYNKNSFKTQILDRMRERAIEYYIKMDNDRKGIALTNAAKSIEEIIRVYINWYYEKYLYHHKEEFLDVYDFVKSNRNCNSEKITDDIQDYYILPFVEIKADEEYFNNLTFEEVNDKVNVGLSNKKIVNAERLNASKYDYKLDYIIFISRWKKNGNFDVSRLQRLLSKMDSKEKELLIKTLINVYSNCIDIGKWNLLKFAYENDNILRINFDYVFNNVYSNNKDNIYYGIMSYKYNKLFNYGGDDNA